MKHQLGLPPDANFHIIEQIDLVPPADYVYEQLAVNQVLPPVLNQPLPPVLGIPLPPVLGAPPVLVLPLTPILGVPQDPLVAPHRFVCVSCLEENADVFFECSSNYFHLHLCKTCTNDNVKKFDNKCPICRVPPANTIQILYDDVQCEHARCLTIKNSLMEQCNCFRYCLIHAQIRVGRNCPCGVRVQSVKEVRGQNIL